MATFHLFCLPICYSKAVMLPWQFAHRLCQKHKTKWTGGRNGLGYMADLIVDSVWSGGGTYRESHRATKYTYSLFMLLWNFRLTLKHFILVYSYLVLCYFLFETVHLNDLQNST